MVVVENEIDVFVLVEIFDYEWVVWVDCVEICFCMIFLWCCLNVFGWLFVLVDFVKNIFVIVVVYVVKCDVMFFFFGIENKCFQDDCIFVGFIEVKNFEWMWVLVVGGVQFGYVIVVVVVYYKYFYCFVCFCQQMCFLRQIYFLWFFCDDCVVVGIFVLINVIFVLIGCDDVGLVVVIDVVRMYVVFVYVISCEMIGLI